MTPETETNINEAINWLQQTGGSLQNFASEQAPLYCREVVAWEKMGGVIDCGIGVALILAAVGLAKASRPTTYDGMFREMIAPGAAAICGLIALLSLGLGVTAITKATIAPRIVIVEHLTGMRK